jgi:hypothetical protein
MITKTFDDKGDFVAYNKACEWCHNNGISCGSMQCNEPVGLMRGDYDISKWRNSSKEDRALLEGTIIGNKRSGPVAISVKEGKE